MNFPLDPNEIFRLNILAALDPEKHVPNTAIDRITAFARSHFGVNICLVTLIRSDTQLILSRQGFNTSETPRKVSFCTYTILNEAVLVVPDARADTRFQSNPLVIGEPFIRFYAGAPLVHSSGVRLGALCLIDAKQRRFSRGEQAELQMLSDHVVGVLVSLALGLPDPDLKAALSI